MGGWVGGWVEEKAVVEMSYCDVWVGGLKACGADLLHTHTEREREGGWVGGLYIHTSTNFKHKLLKVTMPTKTIERTPTLRATTQL